MLPKLTTKQHHTLSIISDYINKNQKSPTFEEIRKELGLASTSSAQVHVKALKRKGYIRTNEFKSRGITPQTANDEVLKIPLVGSISCGTPILAEENITAYIPYKQSQIKGNSYDYFFLRAVGDSMNMAIVNGKNIDNGDFVLVKKTNYADPGSIVVALIGNEATIKILKKEKSFYILEPRSSNEANKPIYVFENLIVQGIVKDVLKGGV